MFQRALILAVFCACLSAQPSACTAGSPNPPSVHSEGLNELVGDIVLNCTSSAPALVNVSVILNAPITGRTMGANGMSEAVLLVDEPGSSGGPALVPASLNPNQQSYFSGPVPGSTPLPNVFQGVQDSTKGLDFIGVPVTAGAHVIRITDIRVDATGLAGNGSPAQVIGFISVRYGLDAVPINTLTLATVQRGLKFSVQHSASYPVSGTGATLDTPIILRFDEGYAGAFQTATPNFPHGYQPIFSPPATLSLVAGILGIPAGGSISAPVKVTGQDGSTNYALVNGNTTASPLGAGYAQVPIVNNQAFLLYAPTSKPNDSRQTLLVAAYSRFFPNAAPTTVGVEGFLAASPYPRYLALGGGPYDAIQTVNPALTTTSLSLTSNVGKANCFAGQPFFGPFNACYSGGPSSAFSFSIYSNASSGTATVNVMSTGALYPFLSEVPGYDTGFFLSELTLPVVGSVNFPTSPPGVSAKSVRAAGAAPAPATTATVTLNVSVPGAGTITQSTPVTILAPTTPVILPQGFTDVADFRGGVVSPGQIFSLFPQTYGQPNAYVAGTVDAKGSLSTTVASTQVLFDGKPAPLLGVTPTQINGVAPFELTGKTTTQVTLVYQDVSSPAIPIPVQPASISIISASGFGGGPCACLNQDGSYNTQANPAHIGDIVTMIVNYGGPMDVPGTDGRSTIAPPYNKPQGPVSASIGGVLVTDLPYYGNLAGFVESAEQWNLRIPPGVPPGLDMIQIKAGGAQNAPFASIWIGQ